MKVEALMHRDVVTVRPETPLREVAALEATSKSSRARARQILTIAGELYRFRQEIQRGT